MNDVRLAFSKKILSAGSLVLDILPRFLPGSGSELASSILAEGKLTESPEFCMYAGGSVGNTGTALAKLDVPVRLKAKIGDDVIGTIVKNLVSGTGAECDFTVMKGEKSTASIALAIPGRDKSTIHQRGASQLLMASDFTEKDFDGIGIFAFGYPTTMKYLYADGGKGLLAVLQMARERQVVTCLDTSLPDLKSDPGQVDWNPVLKRISPYIDIFAPSLEEAIFMLDRQAYVKMAERYGNKNMVPFISNKEITEIGQRLLDWGVQVVMIKCGTHGLYLRTAHPTFLGESWQQRELWATPFDVKDVVSTTGAGDTAIAGFLCAISASLGPETALSLGCYTSSRCVMSYDTCGKIEPAWMMLKAMRFSKRIQVPLNAAYWSSSDNEGVFYGQHERQDFYGAWRHEII